MLESVPGILRPVFSKAQTSRCLVDSIALGNKPAKCVLRCTQADLNPPTIAHIHDPGLLLIDVPQADQCVLYCIIHVIGAAAQIPEPMTNAALKPSTYDTDPCIELIAAG